jgi:hypothetical protein
VKERNGKYMVLYLQYKKENTKIKWKGSPKGSLCPVQKRKYKNKMKESLKGSLSPVQKKKIQKRKKEGSSKGTIGSLDKRKGS